MTRNRKNNYGMATAGSNPTPGRTGLSNDDIIWFLCAIGRIPSTFEYAIITLGTNPFTKSESRKLLSTHPPARPEHHSPSQGNLTICGSCGHQRQGHLKPEVIPPPQDQDLWQGRDMRHWCFEHCQDFYCPDTGLLMANGKQPNCFCTQDCEHNLATVRRLAQCNDFRRGKANKILTRMKQPGAISTLRARLTQRLRCLSKRHSPTDLTRDLTKDLQAPQHMFKTVCTHCNATVHTVDMAAVQ